MKYIVREVGKDGGAEYDNPDDAIYAAAEWEYRTNVSSEIYMRWPIQYPISLGGDVHYAERLSGPHTAEAHSLCQMWELAAPYGSGTARLTRVELMFDRVM